MGSFSVFFQGTVGHIIPLSSFALPQLLAGESGLRLTIEQGSWFGTDLTLYFVILSNVIFLFARNLLTSPYNRGLHGGGAN